MSDFLKGIQYFFAGFGIITKPGIKRFVVIPLIINIVLFSVLFLVIKNYAHLASAYADSYLPAWLHFLSYFIYLFFLIGYFLICIYAFAALGACMAAPFNGLLAAEVELYLTGKPLADKSVWQNVKDIPRLLCRQLSIVGFFLGRAIIILMLSFIPIVNTVTFILWFLFSAWFLTLQYMDFPTDNHHIPIVKVREWLYARRAMTLGFGVCLLVFISIPIVNLFVIPAAVAGATQFFVKEFVSS